MILMLITVAKKFFLRGLGTEGQGNAAYPDRKPYGSMGICLPFGVGAKYAINPRMNIGVEISHRFTNTDYLDDVSKTYVGIDRFLPVPMEIRQLRNASRTGRMKPVLN